MSASPPATELDDVEISTDPARIDFEFVYGYLSQSYWGSGLPREVLVRAIAGSLCFSIYAGDSQVGFARVITDGATFAYLCDVFVTDRFQRQGLGQCLVEAIVAHPRLQGLRRFVLATRDAHGLYEKFGFRPLAQPETFMEIWQPDVYRQA